MGFDARGGAKGAWGLVRPYWVSERKGKAWALLGSVVALDLVSVWMLVIVTGLNKTIYDALVQKHEAAFLTEIGKFFIAACVFIALAVYKLYLRQALEIDWRGWLTRAALGEWMRPGVPARMELASAGADNPDQRVSEDVASLCSLTLALGLGLLTSAVTLASFAGMLWEVSGPLDFSIGSASVHIPGYMMWVALAYSGVGSWLNHLLGRKLIAQSVEQQRREADLRFSMMRARESAEAVALLGGEGAERARAERLFEAVRQNWVAIMRTTKRITGFGVGYSQVAALFPIVVASPRYFAGPLTLGDLMQVGSAFGRVQGALSWFLDSYQSWVAWRAACARLSSFCEAVVRAGEAPAREIGRSESASASAGAGTALELPGGEKLLDVSGFHAPAGIWTLVRGPSGSGKSSMVKAFAGLWREGSGALEAPRGAFFIPQKPFVPAGTVEEALLYPAPGASRPRADVEQALLDAELPRLVGALGTGDVGWSKTLSGGEAQRLGFARAFLAKPDFLFLDEATSAQDEEGEARLMAKLKERLPGAGVVSVGHRSGLAAFHGQVYEVEGSGEPGRLRLAR